jgi:hypothetical protein
VLKKRHNLFAVNLEREFRPKRKQNRLTKEEERKGFCVRLSFRCGANTRTEPALGVTHALQSCSSLTHSG